MRNILASALAVVLLAGCSGGGSKVASSVPNAAPAAQQLVPATMTLTLAQLAQAAKRTPQYIAANVKSISLAVTAIDPQYQAIFGTTAYTSCVNITPGVTTYTLSMFVPPGNVTAVINESDTACGPAGANGVLTPPTTGNIVASATGAGYINPGGGGANTNLSTTLTWTPAAVGGAVVLTPTKLKTAVLALAAGASGFAGSFIMDPAIGGEASPLSVTVTDPSGNTIPAGTVLASTTKLTVTSSSTQVKLALVNTAANSSCAGAIGTICRGPSTSALSLANAPAAGDVLAVFSGVTQSTYTGSTISVSTADITTATSAQTIAISSQPSVTTAVTAPAAPNFAFDSNNPYSAPVADVVACGTGAGPACLVAATGDLGPAANSAASVVYVTDGQLIKWGNNTGKSTKSDTGGANVEVFTGIAWDSNVGNNALYAVDSKCYQCAALGTVYGNYAANAAMPATAGSGLVYTTQAAAQAAATTFVAPVQLVNQSGVANQLINTYGGSFPAGPQGIAYDSQHNLLFVAANNSIYTITFNYGAAGSNPNVGAACVSGVTAANGLCQAATVTLLAGSGNTTATAGVPNGTGYVDNTTGTVARFNFGTTNFIGMTYNTVTGLIYVVDPGNTAIRAINPLTGAVNSVGTAVTSPVGLTFDSNTGNLFVTSAIQTMFQVQSTATAPTNPAGGALATSLFAGQVNVAGANNGFGTGAYTLQLAKNCPVCSTTANALGAPYTGALNFAAGGALVANTLVGTTTVANFNGPKGVAFDPGNGTFILVDSANQSLRIIQ